MDRFISRFIVEVVLRRCRVSGIIGLDRKEIPPALFFSESFCDNFYNAVGSDGNELTLLDGTAMVGIEVEFPAQIEPEPRQFLFPFPSSRRRRESSTSTNVMLPAEEKQPGKPRGPEAKKRNRVVDQIVSEVLSGQITVEALRAMLGKKLAERYRTSATTARNALRAAEEKLSIPGLSEFLRVSPS